MAIGGSGLATSAGGLASLPAARRSRRWIGVLRRHWGLVALVLAGSALRVAAVVAIGPGIWFSDSNVYVASAATGTLSPTRSVGYSLLVTPFWHLHSATGLIVTQHLLGIALVVGLYALLVHRGAPRWLALLGVVPAALDLYLVLVEHTIMAETVFHVSILGAIALLIYRERPGPWAVVAAGTLLGYAGIVRSVGVPMFAAFALFLLVRRVGWRRVALFFAAVAAVTAGYATVFKVQHGTFALSGSSGRFLYGKVAPFADCAKLGDLSAQERALCPDSENRLTPNAYVWGNKSPIHGLRDQELARAFAVRVIRRQPADYAGVVAGGFLHYFRPGHVIGRDDYPVQAWQFPSDPSRWRYPGYRGPIREGLPGRQQRHPISEPNRYVDAMAGPYRVNAAASGVLHWLQLHVYTPGPLFAVCVLLVLAALLMRAGDARLRADAALPCAAALAALLVSQALSVFSYRYGLGLIILLPVAGALAATALLQGRRPAVGSSPASE